jgi:tetratricopeptide (TPR) repeat protein
MLKFNLILSIFLLFCSIAFADNQVDLKEKADNFYAAGDCNSAINIYNRILENTKLTQEVSIDVSMKSALCNYQINNFKEAEILFLKILKTYPDFYEIRVKYFESQFNQSKFDEVIKKLQGTNSRSPFAIDEKIILARAYIEKNEDSKAYKMLYNIKNPGAYKPTIDFWMGVTLFHMEKTDLARKMFQSSQYKSSSEMWTLEASKSWLQTINDYDRKFFPKFNLAFFYDTNSGGYSTSSGLNFSPSSSTSKLNDFGTSATLNLDYVLRKRKLSSVSVGIDISQSIYSKLKSYNVTNQTFRVSGYNQLSQDIRSDWAFSVYNLKYNYIYYNDYATAMVGLNWEAITNYTFNYTFNYNKSFYGVTANTMTNTINLYMNYRPWSPWVSLSTTRVKSDSATIAFSTAPYVSTGSLSSQYTSIGFTTGISRSLEDQHSWSVFGNLTQTKYVKENFPSGSDPYINSSMARADQLVSVTAMYSLPLITTKIISSFAYTFSRNTSKGLQNISYDGNYTHYNYQKHLFSFNSLYAW